MRPCSSSSELAPPVHLSRARVSAHARLRAQGCERTLGTLHRSARWELCELDHQNWWSSSQRTREGQPSPALAPPRATGWATEELTPRPAATQNGSQPGGMVLRTWRDGYRGARIRTGDLTDPNGARYQAAPRPESSHCGTRAARTPARGTRRRGLPARRRPPSVKTRPRPVASVWVRRDNLVMY